MRAALAIRDCVGERGGARSVRIGVNTGEALVSLGARPDAGRGDGRRRRRQHRRAAPVGAPVNGVLVGETTYRATARRDRVPARQTPIDAKGKAEPVAVWEAVDARARFGVDVEQATLDTARRPRARARAAARRARRAARSSASRSSSRSSASRDRQDPARRASCCRSSTHDAELVYLAPGPLPALRRGHQLLGARRDREGAGGHPRDRRRPTRRRRSCDAIGRRARPTPPRRSGSRLISAARRARRRTAAAARTARRRSPPGGASSRRSPSSGRRARLRGSALGRRRPARLRRRARRPGDRRAAARSLHAPARSCSSAARLGRRQAECNHALALAALRRGDGAPARRAALTGGASGRDAADAAPARGGNPLYAEEYVRMLSDRGLLAATAGVAARATERGAGDGAGHDRRPARRPGPTRRPCCRPPPWSGRCSGSGSWQRSPGSRLGRRGAAACSGAQGVRAPRPPRLGGGRDGVLRSARAGPRRRLRADSRAPVALTCTSGPPSGSSRSATTGRRRAEMLAHHYLPRSI